MVAWFVAATVGVVLFGASIDLSNVLVGPIKYFLALWVVVSFIANVVVLVFAARHRDGQLVQVSAHSILNYDVGRLTDSRASLGEVAPRPVGRIEAKN
jgi:hypothetical protein